MKTQMEGFYSETRPGQDPPRTNYYIYLVEEKRYIYFRADENGNIIHSVKVNDSDGKHYKTLTSGVFGRIAPESILKMAGMM